MIELVDDPHAFAQRAGRLIESTVRSTLVATVLHGVLTGHYADPSPRFALVTDPAGAVIGSALRTPPRPLICSALSDADAAALMARWLEVDPEITGVNAEIATARALAGAFTTLTDGSAGLETEEALHCLDPDQLVAPPRPAVGHLRPPGETEHEMIGRWEVAFALEAHLQVDPEQVHRAARVRAENGRTYVWSDAGRPVCLVGHTPMIAEVPRVGPVYTPPEHRSRGYASAAVAALSRRLFDAGATQIVLFTDLANPTANKIYAEVGYRRIADFEIYAFRRSPRRPACPPPGRDRGRSAASRSPARGG